MKNYYTNKQTGIDYTRIADVYLPNLVLPHSDYTVGVWGERYRTYIITHRKPFYTSLKMQCNLDTHLREVDTRASEMYDRLVKQLASKDGITEALKAAAHFYSFVKCFLEKSSSLHKRKKPHTFCMELFS